MMNNPLQELLSAASPLLIDGGMGTMLMAAGLEQGNPPEEWNITHPDKIRAIHRDYVAAGARLLLTNSFGGTRFRLGLHHMQDRAPELNRAAAALARAEADAAPQPVLVAGSMGPTGELLEPLGTMTFEQAKDAFAEQAAALAKGGVDLLWIETMSDLNEVKAAIEGARAACDLPITATMTFDTNGRTMMGVTPVLALQTLRQYNLAAIGANCGNGPAEIEAVIQAMRAADSGITLIAKSNAGLPKWVNGELTYDGTPEVMADYACRARVLGADVIGACCGSTPAHIRAMRRALSAPPDETPVIVTQPADTPAAPSRRRRRRRA
ncbi:MAG: betaine--homocysteine S-methyltransferase [Anaerolineae bacterium]